MSSNSPLASNDYIFDLSVYRLAAIKKATYLFMGQFNVELQVNGNVACVRLTKKQSPAGPDLDPASLTNAVIDQELRETIAQETEAIRNVILAQAFSGLSLIEPVGETAAFTEDPLGIAAPSDPASKRAV
jgi:His-Xaa-Ser system protein HxsD